MSKNLELLKQEFADSKNEGILKYLIPVLEDNEKQIEALSEKVEKLEQEGSYYPRTEKEIKNIKIEGTDPE